MKKQKVLIADDDPDILDAMQLMLQVSDYDVEIIKEGKKIIDKIRSVNPDIVLLDLWMSGVSGIDICNQIRKNKDLRSVPIILVSATNEIKRNAGKADFNDYIAKPFSIEELLTKIETNVYQNSKNSVSQSH